MTAKKSLTGKQRKFAELVFLGDTLRSAYREAYEANDSKMNTIDRNAYSTFRNQKVQAYLAELRKEGITQVIMEKQAKVSLLLNNVHRMMNEGVDKDGKMLPSAMASITKTMELVSRLDGDLSGEQQVTVKTHGEMLKEVLKLKKRSSEDIMTDAMKKYGKQKIEEKKLKNKIC